MKFKLALTPGYIVTQCAILVAETVLVTLLQRELAGPDKAQCR